MALSLPSPIGSPSYAPCSVKIAIDGSFQAAFLGQTYDGLFDSSSYFFVYTKSDGSFDGYVINFSTKTPASFGLTPDEGIPGASGAGPFFYPIGFSFDAGNLFYANGYEQCIGESSVPVS